MNDGWSSAFHAVVCGATLWLVALRAGARLGLPSQTWRAKLGYGLASLVVLFVPWTALPLRTLVFSVCPNPSLPFVGMVLAALWHLLIGRAVLRRADWQLILGWGAVAGTGLYLQPLLLPAVDVYFRGWHHEVAVWSIAGAAVAALLAGNRGGILLLAALIGYELQALESRNAWDYVLDPFYWLVSVSVLASRAVVRLRVWSRHRRIISANTPIALEPPSTPVSAPGAPL